MADTTNRGSMQMDDKKKDMPKDDTQSNNTVNDQGQKGGMAKRDQNDLNNDAEMIEEFEEIDAEY